MRAQSTNGLVPVGDARPVRLPDDWDAAGWDTGRRAPKSPAEATAAARARGDDPAPYRVFEADPGPGPQPQVTPLASGIFVPWLPDAARLTGYPVLLEPGWNGRGHGGLRALEVVVGHHTATPETAGGDYPSLGVVRDGRSGLPGPLAQLGLARSGTIIVIANGLAYHAGVSAYAGFYDLNDESIGIEAEDSGDGSWTAAQLDCYPRLVAALLYYMRRPAQRYCSHRTCALPAGRKIDPAGIADAWMRDRVGAMLADPLALIPRRPQEDDVSWSERLRSHTGYEAPAAEWLIGTNVKADEARAEAARANVRIDELLARAPAAVDATAVAAALADNDEFISRLAARFATANLDEQARRLAD